MSQAIGWNNFVDTETQAEHRRLRLLERIFDPFSLRQLEGLGVEPGWQCLEVGAGAGSLARRMAELAGPGNVVATDLSLKFLDPLTELGVTVLRHDVTTDEAPGEFDLIHTRFVLDHLPGREDVIKRMASWLKPGGWLLLEIGTTMPELSSHPATRRSMAVLTRVMTERVGTAAEWGRTLPVPLEAAGLVDCAAEGSILPARGGEPLAHWLMNTTKLVEPHALATGLITREQLDEAFALYETPSFVDYTWMTVAARGRRP
ncbi:class I SAM-dependent methyltransferase [Amycolatopsis sp. PS_44_ISF1]|uniref:class I SAM-dependent methyltransferase n=1 Tax=Amycolatopsis sp. PS_44_ISF1 TaxID=2974917 RepID=UPI0028DD8566|nr:class I SAM-dependent methyltransferase [Amycolatopsis sp. PS_44_ISF1]MDT8909437.1 class I SAM-dependent methyltransferase [Amycolatopsis sp. PS_44_ISF1]